MSYLKLRARSERLEVRAYSLADYHAWREGHLGRKPKQHRFDEETIKPSILTRDFFRKRVQNHRTSAKKNTHFNFAIFDRRSGAALGFIGYNLIDRQMRWANLGYSVHNQHWGRGIGPEAARLCLKIGFGPLNLHRIEASCEPGNKASAKVALRAGLRPEGKRRKFFAHKGGVDMVVFAENQIDYGKKQRAH
jgi:RimJ/RimL family protein N-acetyltransferase